MGEEQKNRQDNRIKPHKSSLSKMLKTIIVLEALLIGVLAVVFAMDYSLIHFLQVGVLVALVSIPFLFLANRFIDKFVEIEMEELKKKEEEHIAKMAADNKTYFLTNVSHEIRTPVNAVLGMNEMILRESKEDQTRRYAREIRTSGRALLAMIDEILDSARLESGEMKLEPVEFDLMASVNDVVNLNAFRAKEKGIEFHTDFDPSTPRLLYGDEIRFKQILSNLLHNAVKYTKEGRVDVSLKYEKQDDNHVILNVSVKDTGIGIKKEDLDKISMRFERLDEGVNRSLAGTGLGMNIVKELLSLMGGELSVESEYGVGSVFSFTLPVEVVKWFEVGYLDTEEETESDANKRGKVLQAPEACVLIVDDTPMNITVMRSLLKESKIQVDAAESGFQAFEMVGQKKYDIIFLDHRMPEMDGVETLERMKQLPSNLNKETPVIALTANVITGGGAKYKEVGFTEYLPKPVDGHSLEILLEDQLPTEKIAYVSFSEEKPKETYEQLECDHPMCALLHVIPNLEPKKGYELCGGEEVFLKVLREFGDNTAKKSAEIEDFLAKKDLENYTIWVHALKSSARLIGAEKLSEDAKRLEDLGGKALIKDDVALRGIEANTPRLLEDYRLIGGGIKKAFEEAKSKEEKKPISKEEFFEALRGLREYADAFDFDGADSVVAMLKEYEIPAEYQEDFETITGLVSDVNQLELIGKLDKMQQRD